MLLSSDIAPVNFTLCDDVYHIIMTPENSYVPALKALHSQHQTWAVHNAKILFLGTT